MLAQAKHLYLNISMWTNKNSYILSKAYPNDFSSIKIDENGELNIEGFCAVKALLRLARTKRTEDVSYFVEEYPKLLNAIDCIVAKLKSKESNNHNIRKFLYHVRKKEYKSACDCSTNALEEIKKINSEFYEVYERNDSYFVGDYFKIINSSSFRRLQDKTQLYVNEAEDFPRKRLTHSIEVSAIGERIASRCQIELHIRKKLKSPQDSYYAKNDCVTILKSAGVLHDIGNPPFGHSGEKSISCFFKKASIVKSLSEHGITVESPLYKDISLFDGNAQSLRIASKLMSFGNEEGSALTSGVYASIIKYPFGSEDTDKNKIGYFKTEQKLIEDLEHFGVYKKNCRNPFACILELSDDLAYLISDLEDAVHKRELTYENFFNKLSKKMGDEQIDDFFEKMNNRYQLEKKIEKDEYVAFERIIRPLLYKFRENVINSINYIVTDKETTGVENNIFKYIVTKGVDHDFSIMKYSKYSPLFEALKEIKNDLFARSDAIRANEKNGDTIIDYLMGKYYCAIIDAEVNWKDGTFASKSDYNNKIIHRLSDSFVGSFFKEFPKDKRNDLSIVTYYKMRLLIDQISGMTDCFAQAEFEEIQRIK